LPTIEQLDRRPEQIGAGIPMPTLKVAKIFSAALALALPLGLPSAASAQTVKVGFIGSLSGPFAQLGEGMDRGARLYEKLHRKDLPAGVTLEIIRRDDAGSPDNTRRIAQELIVRDKVQIITGIALSPQGFAIAPIATEAKVPVLLASATTSSLTRTSPYLVRFSYTQWQMGHSMGVWAKKNGMKKVYVVVADYAAGHDSEAAFKKGFEGDGSTVIGTVRTPMTTTDYLPFFERIKGEKPDAIFVFVNLGRMPALVKAWVDTGMRADGVKLIGPGDATQDDELLTMPPEIAGMITAGVYLVANPIPQNTAFIKAWKAEYGADSLPNTVSASGWDAMSAIFSAIKATKGKMDSESVMKHLAGWKSTESPKGAISIDAETRDIILPVYIMRVTTKGGKPANEIIETIPGVKDPWKTFNPQ
jgi:branched-chain amino acid transport system substrate-binding protein